MLVMVMVGCLLRGGEAPRVSQSPLLRFAQRRLWETLGASTYFTWGTLPASNVSFPARRALIQYS